MTIAACYLSSEGVILGADSTSTVTLTTGQMQHLEHAQKLFEIGERGTLAVVCWGIGQLAGTSYRTMAAELDDEIRRGNIPDFPGAVQWWRDKFFSIYESEYAADLVIARSLLAKRAMGQLSPTENQLLNNYATLNGGFCIAGRFSPERQPRAFQIIYGLEIDKSQSISEIGPAPTWSFWGCPQITDRIVDGVDRNVKSLILQSGKWMGTPSELDATLHPLRLEPYTNVHLPLREASDWIFSMIFSTVKAFKFSTLPPVCGGPIDIAMISSDRPFRWIRHKAFGAAIARDDHHHSIGATP